MDKVCKSSNSECYTPSSEYFRLCTGLLCAALSTQDAKYISHQMLLTWLCILSEGNCPNASSPLLQANISAWERLSVVPPVHRLVTFFGAATSVWWSGGYWGRVQMPTLKFVFLTCLITMAYIQPIKIQLCDPKIEYCQWHVCIAACFSVGLCKGSRSPF
jgi:hypothetical protein